MTMENEGWRGEGDGRLRPEKGGQRCRHHVEEQGMNDGRISEMLMVKIRGWKPISFCAL